MSENIERKIDRILFYLESDESTGHIGLAEQTQINTKEIQDIKTDKKVLAGKMTVVGVIFGFIGGNIMNIIKIIKMVF